MCESCCPEGTRFSFSQFWSADHHWWNSIAISNGTFIKHSTSSREDHRKGIDDVSDSFNIKIFGRATGMDPLPPLASLKDGVCSPAPDSLQPESWPFPLVSVVCSCIEGIFECIGDTIMAIIDVIADCLECIIGSMSKWFQFLGETQDYFVCLAVADCLAAVVDHQQTGQEYTSRYLARYGPQRTQRCISL